jgi:hypothetical protein
MYGLSKYTTLRQAQYRIVSTETHDKQNYQNLTDLHLDISCQSHMYETPHAAQSESV